MSTSDWILIVYAGVTTAALLMLWGNLLVNLFIFRRPPVVSASVLGSPAPLVSVCVPARNEALRIGNLLRSLAAQDYPDFEVIILNDRSEDDTTAVLQAWQNDIPRMRVMAGESLPRGWVGKCWACHQLSREARGHYILFTDADTILHPQCLSSAVQFAQAHDAALTSLWPRQMAGTWSEKLIIPFVYQLLLVFLPHALVNRISHAGLGAANGQFVLFRRSDYDALGGHEAVRNHLVEDVALARATLAAGRKLLNVDGTELVSCRMYHRFADLWEGFTKNLRAAFEKNAGAFVFFGVLQATVLLGAFYLVPILLIIKGGEWLLTLPGILLLAQIALIWLMRVVFAVRFKQSVLWAFAHPIGQTLALVIALNSWVQTATGGVKWKGRIYKPEV